ncbi:helix-turn-helix transcriptional regulator [Nonomuraea sp. NPDC050404]|uniref:helix-turn-helix domain-containing protein n=1 Tax=Nonomuraea sp. NPDC050404 TaxID=3155783 RepID=UPI0033DBCFA6
MSNTGPKFPHAILRTTPPRRSTAHSSWRPSRKRPLNPSPARHRNASPSCPVPWPSGTGKPERHLVAVVAPGRRNQVYIDGYRWQYDARALGLPQTEVADLMGVTKGRISQIERSEVSIWRLSPATC